MRVSELKFRPPLYCVALWLVLGVGVRASAQTISYSPYSAYGVGLLKERTSSHNRALAGTGIGLRDDFNLNNVNPASYTSIQGITQVLEIGAYYEGNRLTTSDRSERSSTGNLTSVNMWFRLAKKWAGTVGLAPFSNVDYNILSSRNFGDENDVVIRYSGQGGLTQAYFGNGFNITKNLSVGLTGSFLFGSIDKEETITTGQAAGLSLENKVSIYRPAFDAGVQYTVNLSKERSITFGAVASNKVRLNTSNNIRVYEVSGQDSLYVTQESIDDYVLPASVGAGVSFRTPKHLLAADVKFKDWSGATLDNGLELQDVTRLSAAYEYRGNPKASTYWGFVALRSGFFIQNNYFELNNTSFNEWGVTVGAGFPLAGNKGTLHVSYNFNRYGTTSNRLIEQQAQVLVLDFVFRDIWGIRRRFD